MDIIVSKTMLWSECKDIILPLAKLSLGKPKNSKPANFAEFVTAYPSICYGRIRPFLEEVSLRKCISDITDIALVSEDACLFSTEPGSAMEIISGHLRILNSGGKLPSLWCYLDCDEKAIVHFVNKSGWYAEAFFSCNEDFSVMHLFNDGWANQFMPVVFTTELEKYKGLAIKEGGNCLRQYKACDLYSFLSKSGKKNKNQDLAKPPKKGAFPKIKGDNL